jgi:hypothetical protein
MNNFLDEGCKKKIQTAILIENVEECAEIKLLLLRIAETALQNFLAKK